MNCTQAASSVYANTSMSSFMPIQAEQGRHRTLSSEHRNVDYNQQFREYNTLPYNSTQHNQQACCYSTSQPNITDQRETCVSHQKQAVYLSPTHNKKTPTLSVSDPRMQAVHGARAKRQPYGFERITMGPMSEVNSPSPPYSLCPFFTFPAFGTLVLALLFVNLYIYTYTNTFS